MHQRKYTLELITSEFDHHVGTTPSYDPDIGIYQILVGQFYYFTITKPNITFEI